MSPSTAPETLELSRDCDGVLIPAGVAMRLKRGTRARLMQSLGGAYTVEIATGELVRISGDDADALGLQPEAPETAPAAVAGGEGTAATGAAASTVPLGVEDQAWAALRTCYDPEIPVNIVDLGLVYDLAITGEEGASHIDVKMTLTAQGCGMGGAIAQDAERKLTKVPGVAAAVVAVVWDPPWNPGMISDEGRRKLGIA